MCGGDSLSEVGAFAFGPISGVLWKSQKVIEEFWDIGNNGYLDKKVKEETRAEEPAWIGKGDLFSRIHYHRKLNCDVYARVVRGA